MVSATKGGSVGSPNKKNNHEWVPAQFKPEPLQHVRNSQEMATTLANEENRKKSVREYSIREEVFNSVTHGLGAALAIAAIPLCTVVAVGDGGGLTLAAALIYSIFMFLEYTMSTLYHAIQADGAKRVFKVLDHSFIYLFIAATYTPYCLVTLAGGHGVALCIFVWAVALIGVAAEAFWVFRPRWISAVLYLLLGWSIIAFLPELYALLDPAGFWLLLAGGLCYSVGCIFYVLKKVPYMHSLFHLWVLAGSICHFFSIILFVL